MLLSVGLDDGIEKLIKLTGLPGNWRGNELQASENYDYREIIKEHFRSLYKVLV